MQIFFTFTPYTFTYNEWPKFSPKQGFVYKLKDRKRHHFQKVTWADKISRLSFSGATLAFCRHDQIHPEWSRKSLHLFFNELFSVSIKVTMTLGNEPTILAQCALKSTACFPVLLSIAGFSLVQCYLIKTTIKKNTKHLQQGFPELL